MEFIKEYAALIMAIIDAVGILIILKKMPREMENMDADTVQKYADAADRAVAQNEKLEGKFDELQKKAESLAAEIKELKKIIGEKEKVITEWAAGIDRLIHQICSLDAVPVWKPGDEAMPEIGANGSKPKSRKKKSTSA
jgi:peptidoglycan hydrolase CwlO-like protein